MDSLMGYMYEPIYKILSIQLPLISYAIIWDSSGFRYYNVKFDLICHIIHKFWGLIWNNHYKNMYELAANIFWCEVDTWWESPGKNLDPGMGSMVDILQMAFSNKFVFVANIFCRKFYGSLF